MQLVENWKAIAMRAWSMRFILLATIFGAMELALPAFEGVLPPRTFAVLSLLTVCAAGVSRLIAQPQTLPRNGSHS